MSYATNFQGSHTEPVHDDKYAGLVHSTLCHYDSELDKQVDLYLRDCVEQDDELSAEELSEERATLRRDTNFYFLTDVLDEVQAIAELIDSQKVGEVVLAAMEARIAFDSMCGTLDSYQRVAYETARAIMLRMPTYEEWLAVNPNPEDSTNDVKKKEATA